MPVTQTTTNRGYPLPYPSNLLADDVQRLRDALQAIDNDVVARPTSTTVQGMVDAAVAALVNGSPTALDTLNELAAALGNDASFATTVTNALAAKAPLNSPTFTGTVTIPSGASIAGYLTSAAAASTYAALAAAQTFTAAQRGAISALNDGATITPDFAVANNFSVTLAGNRTLANPTNLIAGQSGCIYITQDATGSRTLAYGSNWDFAGGTAPTLSTAAGAVDALAYAVRTTGSIAATLIKDVK